MTHLDQTIPKQEFEFDFKIGLLVWGLKGCTGQKNCCICQYKHYFVSARRYSTQKSFLKTCQCICQYVSVGRNYTRFIFHHRYKPSFLAFPVWDVSAVKKRALYLQGSRIVLE